MKENKLIKNNLINHTMFCSHYFKSCNSTKTAFDSGMLEQNVTLLHISLQNIDGYYRYYEIK